MKRGVMTVFSFLLLNLFMLGSAQAVVPDPRLSVQTLSTDTGASSSAGSLIMDATAISLILTSGPIDIADIDFNLTADYNSTNANTHNFTNGVLTIGSSVLATFDSLDIFDLGASATFAADLTYTGGDLVGSLTTGRIEGGLFNINGDLDGTFYATTLIADVGAVAAVPLPAAAWLFIAGLVGLGTAARRKLA